jgi:hypothetical protein
MATRTVAHPQGEPPGHGKFPPMKWPYAALHLIKTAGGVINKFRIEGSFNLMYQSSKKV